MRSRLVNLFLEGNEKVSEVENSPPKIQFCLLLVDDEPDIINALKRVFREENYRILSAGSGEEALKVLEKNEVQVIISDHRMPGMSGAEFLGAVKERHPATIRIMLTGYADIASVMGAINTGAVYKFITKPWNDEDLRITVSLAFEQYELMIENRELKKQAHTRQEEIKKLARYVEINRSQLVNIIHQNGLLDKEKRDKVIKAHERTKKPYPQLLQDLDYMSFSQLSGFLKAKLNIDTVAPKEYEPIAALVELFPQDFCRNNKIMPLKRTEQRRILLGMADPTDYGLIEDIKFFTGFDITPVLAPLRDLEEAQDRFFGKPSLDVSGADFSMDASQIQMAEYDPYESIEVVLDEEESRSVEEIIKDSSTPPAIRLVNLIIWEALKARASDIHIEKRVKCSLVRFRVDGLLQDRIQIPESMHQPLVSRIKIMADMDISERRRPQDGRITIKAQTKTVDLRISSLPTISGEKVVMRLLDRNTSLINLNELGVDRCDIEQLQALIQKPQGMIISTGPTGSGKTTTLYALLKEHAKPNVNYVTIEDPVEYFLEYAGQVLVKDKIGLNFDTILRAILRQDPNVILLGEIRDFATAEVAFHAALTGHLVLSTLHTNNTVATISRLLDLGVKPYIISSALEGIIAQRLVRRICPDCKQEIKPDLQILKLLGNPEIKKAYIGKGCSRCNKSGFIGRVGIFEIMTPSQEMKQIIAENFSENELLRAARLHGMRTLLESGIEKVNQGETSLSEIFRMLGPQEDCVLLCPSCNKLVQGYMNFCASCGAKIKMVCPKCGSKVDKSWKHCSSCGYSLMALNEKPAGKLISEKPGTEPVQIKNLESF